MTAPDVSDEYFLLGLTMVDALFTGDQKTFDETEKLFAPADLAAVFAHLSYTLALELGGLYAPEEPDMMVAARSALRALRFDYLEHMDSPPQDGVKE